MKFYIYKHIADLSGPNNGWIKELNSVSWNNREPVYDIRAWNEDHTKYGNGVTITAGEMVLLKEALNRIRIF